MRKVVLFVVLLILLQGCAELGRIGLSPPVIVVFEADQTTVNRGQAVTLVWNVTGATYVTVDQGVGSLPVAGTRRLSPDSTTAYTLTATNDFGTVSRSVVVTVNAPLAGSFDVEPATIPAGGSACLRWNVEGASSVTMDQDIKNVSPTGARWVSPGATTVYTLTAANSSSTFIKSVVLTVSSPVIVANLDIHPVEIASGGQATLMWSVVGATSVSIEPGIGLVEASGSVIVSPGASTTYVLTATNESISVSRSASVAVGSASASQELPVVAILSVSPGTVTPGQSVTIEWLVLGADSVAIDHGIGSVQLSGKMVISPPTGTTTYTLTATNNAGVVKRSITVIASLPSG